MNINKHLLWPGMIALASVLSACGGGSSNNTTSASATIDSASSTNTGMMSFDITVSNATNNQPLAPVGVALHEAGYSAWQIGTAASAGLEFLAEGGNPAMFLDEAQAAPQFLTQTTGTAPIGGGGSETLSISVTNAVNLHLTLAAMLVHTNDAYTGVTNMPIDLTVNESLTFYTAVYDAGTEADDERAVPGPDVGGEGFNAARNDGANEVRRHPGVVTRDDGLLTSLLNESHRFLDGGAARVTVTRTQ